MLLSRKESSAEKQNHHLATEYICVEMVVEIILIKRHRTDLIFCEMPEEYQRVRMFRIPACSRQEAIHELDDLLLIPLATRAMKDGHFHFSPISRLLHYYLLHVHSPSASLARLNKGKD